MIKRVFPTKEELAKAAAEKAGTLMRRKIDDKGHVNIMITVERELQATLKKLGQSDGVDWRKVHMLNAWDFHKLDVNEPACAYRRLFLDFAGKTTERPNTYFVLSDGLCPENECRFLKELTDAYPIDLCLVGLCDCHRGCLAFNKPPADLSEREPYFVRHLDDECRKNIVRRQLFLAEDEVPDRVITVSVPQLMKSETIICPAPGKRKARVVKKVVEKEVTPKCPASLLRLHPNCHLFLDEESASKLEKPDAIAT